MEVDEVSRHAMFNRLEEVLGVDTAGTLMAHLPPVGWGDVATKNDLQHMVELLRAEMRADFAGIREDIAAMEARLTRLMANQARTMYFAMITMMITLTALLLGTT